MLTERQQDAVHARVCLLYREHLGRGGKPSSPYEFMRDEMERMRLRALRIDKPRRLSNCKTLMDIDGQRLEIDFRDIVPEIFAKVRCYE
jgi:hypothetical protein